MPIGMLVESGRRAVLRYVRRCARSGGYPISQGGVRVHYGLGQNVKADVTIRCPQSATETLKDVAANQWIVVREGQGSWRGILSASEVRLANE